MSFEFLRLSDKLCTLTHTQRREKESCRRLNFFSSNSFSLKRQSLQIIRERERERERERVLGQANHPKLAPLIITCVTIDDLWRPISYSGSDWPGSVKSPEPRQQRHFKDDKLISSHTHTVTHVHSSQWHPPSLSLKYHQVSTILAAAEKLKRCN